MALTDKDLRLKFEKAIEEMEKIIDDDTSSGNQKAYASQTMSSLSVKYKELFNVSPEKKAKMKSVKNF
jgi:hypothetical protein